MTDDAKKKTEPAAKQEWHFGGPPGALAMMLLLPVLTVYLWISVHRYHGALVLPTLDVLRQAPVPTARATILVLAFLALQIALQVVLPGRTAEGLPGHDKLKLKYKLNGFLSLWVTLAILGGLLTAKVFTASMVLDELGPMLAVSVVGAYLLGLFLYAYGFMSPREERRSGNVVYDYFMGTALNPRVASARVARAELATGGEASVGTTTVEDPTTGFDLKLFFESKIGMTAWIAVTMTMAAAELERTGAISTSMALVAGFHLLYVADFYFFEDAMLSTWDINYENFGYMLGFGFVVWMPFTFSLQAQYLVYHQPRLPVWAALLITALNLTGYYIFRSSNLQKHRFKTQPASRIWGKEPAFIPTKRGTKLLVSGWWGLARHANYLGDLTMALAWCLPCGFSHVTPYFYFIYFAPLLIDRERRDHHVCAKKYGDDWEVYCKRVPYRIFPGVY
ncbi:MAG: hypothetical protein U0271_00640 [Polyangiaceae bacterium]